jgi:hypothetical protein
MAEHKEPSALRGWVIVVVACAGIVAWGMVNYQFIKDEPRQWDFGALPDVPGESAYSTTAQPRQGEPPKQIKALPEALPREEPGDTR